MTRADGDVENASVGTALTLAFAFGAADCFGSISAKRSASRSKSQ